MGVQFTAASSERLTFSPPFTVTTNFTLMLWAISDDTSSSNAFFGLGPSSSFGGYSIDQSANDSGANGDYWSAHAPGIVIKSSDSTITQGVWTHVCISRGASTWAMHIDGVAQAVSHTNSPTNTIALGAIGSRPEGGTYVRPLNGKTAEARAWNTQLTTEQINIEMRSKKPRMALSNLKFWLPMTNIAVPSTYTDFFGGKNATPVNTPTAYQHTHF